MGEHEYAHGRTRSNVVWVSLPPIEMRRRVLLAVTGATGSAASMLSTDREPFGVDRLLDGYQR